MLWKVFSGLLIAFVLVGPCVGQTTQASTNREAAKKKDPLSGLSPISRSYWRRYWKTFASNYVQFGEDVLCIRGYNPKYPSSRGKTVKDVLRANRSGYTAKARGYRGAERTERVNMPAADAQVEAMVLPELSIGQYGWIYSVRIERVLGDDDMVVRDVRRINCDDYRRDRDNDRSELSRRYNNWKLAGELTDYMYKNRDALCRDEWSGRSTYLRLQGFDTSGLTSGMTWRGKKDGGIHLAILGLITADSDKGRRYHEWSDGRRLLVAVPTSRLKEGLTEKQFRDLIQKRGFTLQSFIDLVEKERRSSSSNYKDKVLDALEAAAENSDDATE